MYCARIGAAAKTVERTVVDKRMKRRAAEDRLLERKDQHHGGTTGAVVTAALARTPFVDLRLQQPGLRVNLTEENEKTPAGSAMTAS